MMMIRKMMKKSKEQKGFTLIELIVVIAILGILAALAVPRIMGVISNAQDNSDIANAEIIQNAVERYYIDMDDTYPAALADLKATDKTNAAGDSKGPWLKEIPKTNDNKDFGYVAGTGVVSVPDPE